MSNYVDVSVLNVSTCDFCGVYFKDYPSNHRKFCSQECYSKSRLGTKGYWAGTKRWKDKVHPSWKGGMPKCIGCNVILRNRYAKRCRDCNTSRFQGKNHWNWKNGNESRRIRSSSKYISWRNSIFERDDYTCRGCGKRGGNLEVHHIKSFAEYPELRFLMNNGITYCQTCHAKNDKYRAFHLKK